MTTPLFNLRPVQAEDESFLLQLYASARAEEIAQVAWDETQKQAFLQMQFAAQQNHYRAYFPEATHSLILVDQVPVGQIYLDRRAAEIRILDLTLLPSARGRGLGTHLLQELIKEVETTHKTLSLYVESFNRSLGLFARLGFVKAGDNGLSCLLEWHPAAK
jgi:ribosomal protein S18 acetylase RimI-like enzyme